MQGNMLSATLFDQREGTYIQQLVLRTSENLDEDAYRAAWTRLVARHDILRTAFAWRNLEAPQQRVEPAVTMPWSDLDWRGLARAEQESRFDAFLAEDRLRGFDMAEAPLHRLSLIRTGEDEHWAIWTYHHALLDGRARLIIMEELFRVYQALRDGHEPELAPPTPYRNYIGWLDSLDFAASENYWRDLLADFEEPNRILSALSEPRPLSPAHTGGLVQAWAPKALYEALQELAEKQDVTLNTLVQAAWGLLIARHSGLDDVVFGATRSCRKSVPGGEAIVGPIINTTPVRLKIDPARPVAEFIRELRRQHLSVRDHEHTPTARIHEWSGLPAGMPLFTTIVVFENYHVVKSRGGDWDKRRFELKEQTDHLILAGYLADGLLLKIEYDRRLFEDDTVERMLRQLLTIIESLVACADGKLADLRSLPDGELHRLLAEWNDTRADYAEVTLGELFSAQARRTPDAIAVQSGNRRLSYGELDRRSNRLANLLLHKGTGPGSVVALLLDRSCELAVGLLGVLKAGGAYLPLDPAYPEERLAYMLEDSGARIVLTLTALADALRRPSVELLRLDTGWETDPAGSDDAPLPTSATPDDVAYLMYTSGSTGLPKGVMVPHRGVVNLCAAMRRRYGLGPHDRVLQYASISFDICVEEIYPTWHAGGTVVFRDETQGHSVHEFLDWAAREGITVFNLPTAFWNELVRGLGASGAGLPDSLRLTVVGGEKASRAKLEAWNRLPGAARVAWLNTYGPTETTVTATVYQPPQFSPATSPAADPPIGRPIDNVRLYVLDRHLKPVPIGVPGELYISGAGVAKGYLRRPELTAVAFVPDPFAGDPAARMYRTGDLVRYGADGQLSFVGRNDNQVKISGFRVEPGAIEAAIERHDGVTQAAVKAIEAAGGKYLAAYVVPAPGGRFEAEGLEAFLRETLPEHEIPRVFVAMAEFPLTPGGKLDRKALPDPAAPSPAAGGAEPPRNDTERKLAAIFEELFPARSIGIRDNFFAMGGDSLRAFQLLTRIELVCGKRLSFAALARAATVEQLAALVDGSGETEHTHIVPLSLEAAQAPALFLIHGVGGSVHWYHALAELLKADFKVYGIQSPGMDEGEDAMVGTDIESLARLYISEIKGIQAEGPYWIGGHSMGGIIAFEMARQFHALGDEVALVANFDNWNRAADAPGFITKLLRLAVHFLKLGAADKLRFLRDKMRWAKQCFSARLARGRADVRPLEEMKAANVKAAYRYVPGFYPGALTLFRARQQATTALDDPLLGWNGLAEEIDVVEVPGDHYTLLGEPHVRTLADELRRRARLLGSSGR
jgi:amino acid adenylation domain-containing protein